MAWKVKEKEVSIEDAIDASKTELQPHWYGSSPLVIGVKMPDRVALFPLNPEFPKHPWIIFCVDITDFSGLSACQFAKEWLRRYHTHQMDCLIIITPCYSFLRDGPFVRDMLERLQINLICTVDIQEVLFFALEVKQQPKVILQTNQVRHFEFDGEGWLERPEKEIHQFLWKNDPELPLLPVYQPPKTSIDVDRIEFGFDPKWGRVWKWEEAAFKSAQSPDLPRQGVFKEKPPAQLKPGDLFISGEWSQTNETIFTSDKKAMIGFYCKGERLSILAKTLAKRPETSVIVVEVNHQPAYQAIMGENAFMDDSASSAVKIDQPALYHALNNLPKNTREIILKFPSADVAPVALFGLRIGDMLGKF